MVAVLWAAAGTANTASAAARTRLRTNFVLVMTAPSAKTAGINIWEHPGKGKVFTKSSFRKIKSLRDYLALCVEGFRTSAPASGIATKNRSNVAGSGPGDSSIAKSILARVPAGLAGNPTGYTAWVIIR